MIVGYYKNYLYTKDISLALKKKNKESQHMVSLPETGSDSPIGSDLNRGRDNSKTMLLQRYLENKSAIVATLP